jgi:uncharacterized integral membrane protein
MRVVLILLVVVMGLVAAFAIQNAGTITVHFLHLSADTSVPVVIIAAFGAGILVGFLGGIPAAFRRRRRIRDLEAELAAPRGAEPPSPPTAP